MWNGNVHLLRTSATVFSTPNQVQNSAKESNVRDGQVEHEAMEATVVRKTAQKQNTYQFALVDHGSDDTFRATQNRPVKFVAF